MRPSILAITVIAALVATAPARGAPTCQTLDGDTARCGTPGAMPVGWIPSPQRLLERQASKPDQPLAGELAAVFCVIGGLFLLIALMPPFDGSRGGDWDRQEGDDPGPE
jgi:hypothetical protein